MSLRREEGEGKSLGFSSCLSEPALPSSTPVTLVSSLAGSGLFPHLRNGDKRARGFAPTPAQHPGGRPASARPRTGSAHRRNASCRREQEGPAVDEGSW